MAKFHLLPIAIGAAVGVGAYMVSKYLNRDQESEHIVEDEAFDEAAGEENSDTEEPQEDEEPVTPEEPQAPAAPAEAPKGPINIPIDDGDDLPNPNPVKDATEPASVDEDGKVDPTTIAKAEDFGDWEESGCRG